MIGNTKSLSETVDALNDAFFTGAKLSAGDRTEVAKWIATRQGLPGAYWNSFAGFDHERAKGIKVFTGEAIASASARHILGEETCRVMRMLNVRDAKVQQALERANDGLIQSIARAHQDPRNSNVGLFCCGKCSVGVWRNLLSGGLDRQEERLSKGVKKLPQVRDGKGGWDKFPFWYTILALTEIESPVAKSELKYAAPVLEKAAKRSPGSSKYTQRRHTIATDALGRI